MGPVRSRERELVRGEIERLHDFLGQWLSGALAEKDEVFDHGISERLHPAFVNVQPAGIALTRDELLGRIRAGWGRSPDFRIRIRDVRLRPVTAGSGVLVATYEEYQRGARNSEQSDNARLSTAVFLPRPDGRLLWLHVHETWLPETAHVPDGFDF